MNRVVKTEVAKNKQQEDNVRSVELDFMLVLETLIEETPDLIQQQGCLDDNNLSQRPENLYRSSSRD